MKLKLIPVPHLVIEKDLKGKQNGYTKTAMIVLDKNFLNKDVVYNHELMHVFQFYLLTLLCGLLLYPFIGLLGVVVGIPLQAVLYKSRFFRLHFEAQAFAYALSKVKRNKNKHFESKVNALYKDYDLGINKDRAREVLNYYCKLLKVGK